MCRLLCFIFFFLLSLYISIHGQRKLAHSQVTSFGVSPVWIILESTGGRRRGRTLKEPIVNWWYPAPRTEKGILTLSHLGGTSRNFIWCKLAMISELLFLSLICVLSFLVMLFFSLLEMREKLKVWRRLFHTYLRGELEVEILSSQVPLFFSSRRRLPIFLHFRKTDIIQ